MNNWMKVFGATTFVAVGSLALASNAYGQFEAIPTNCIIIADQAIVVLEDDPDNPLGFTSEGDMDLSPLENFEDANGINWMTLNNDGFSAQTDDSELGTITWELDEDRPVESSFIRSDQADALFPATIQLNFNVRATIESQPGRVFISSAPVSLSSNSPLITDEEREQFPVMNWPPGDIFLGSVDADGNGEADEVQFVDQETGEAAFRVVLRSWIRD